MDKFWPLQVGNVESSNDEASKQSQSSIILVKVKIPGQAAVRLKPPQFRRHTASATDSVEAKQCPLSYRHLQQIISIAVDACIAAERLNHTCA
jgi:hypothetical protein